MAAFTRPVKDLTLDEGDCGIFEVRFQPANYIVNWFRNNCPIEDSSDFRILTKNGISTLVIGEIFKDDEGVFTCKLKHPDDPTDPGIQSSGLLTVRDARTKSMGTGQKCPSALMRPIQSCQNQPQYHPPAPEPKSFTPQIQSQSVTSLNNYSDAESNISRPPPIPSRPKNFIKPVLKSKRLNQSQPGP